MYTGTSALARAFGSITPRRARAGLIFCAGLLCQQAPAQEPSAFCTDRPGLGTPTCTIDRGRVALELGVLDYALDRRAGVTEHTLSTGDILVRYGLTDRSEVQLGWAAFNHVRTRAAGVIKRTTGTGDLSVAFRRTLLSGDEGGLSAAAMPYATLPTGSNGMGAGDWGAGLLLPVGAELPAGFGLGLTGSIEAAVDADRDGRHLAYGAVIGLELPSAGPIGATIEFAARRDRDPEGARTEWLAGLSASWSATPDLQVDIGADAGLDPDTPDIVLHLGFAHRF